MYIQKQALPDTAMSCSDIISYDMAFHAEQQK